MRGKDIEFMENEEVDKLNEQFSKDSSFSNELKINENDRSTEDNNFTKDFIKHETPYELESLPHISILKKQSNSKSPRKFDENKSDESNSTKSHISFSEQLINVHIVENWKEYNAMDD